MRLHECAPKISGMPSTHNAGDRRTADTLPTFFNAPYIRVEPQTGFPYRPGQCRHGSSRDSSLALRDVPNLRSRALVRIAIIN